MEEIWKTIPGLPNYYRASNLGNIKRVSHIINTRRGFMKLKEKILNGRKSTSGYFQVYLKFKFYHIHRLVLMAFIKQPKGKDFANHLNGIKTDNSLRNLEWVTTKENTDHAIKTGLMKKYGEHNPGHKLKNHEVLMISRRLELGESEKSLAEEFHVHRDTIHRINIKKYWKHLLNGQLTIDN